MAFILKFMTVLHNDRKSLYDCVLRREVCVSRKLLIDMMLERSYILMGGIRLHEKA